MMNFKKIGESVARAALENTMDGKNIGEILEGAAEKAVETVAEDLSNQAPVNLPQELPDTADKNVRHENLIISVVSIVAKFLFGLFSKK